MRGPNRKFSEARKGIFFLGISLVAIGLVSFLSVLVSALSTSSGFSNIGQLLQSIGLRSVGGITLMIVGIVLMRVGGREAVGVGMPSESKKVREELEPLSRRAGVLTEALDEPGLDQPEQDRDDED